MKTLLAAVDFSDASPLVVDQATTLARALDARIVLLHVVEPVASFVPVGVAMDVIQTPPPSILPDNLTAQRQHLERLAAGAENIEPRVVIGLAADEIASQAESSHADLILLASHGHGALHHLFAGSVVTGVLKRASIPVLVVPARRT